ncbi:UvrD-helicase domain-containing protein [Mucisphaera sp.]|uniref:UvrD-helicase domain-containing protein n=1 Tax=Mucisphaera sp. TaxID=2913024 RepID=UPI003D110439
MAELEPNNSSMLDHRLIRASAGSGKTFQLACRYLTLLHAGAKPQEILATTFTRAAAGEIRDRILRWLVEATLNPEKLNQLRAETALPLTQTRTRELFDQLLPALPHLPIGTIDSTFHRIASAFSDELGIPDEPLLIDDRSALAEDLRLRSVERLLARSAADNDFETLIAWLRQLGAGDATRSVIEAIERLVKDLTPTWTEAPNPDLWHFPIEGKKLTETQRSQFIDQLASLEEDLPKKKNSEDPDKRFCNAWLATLDDLRTNNWEAFLTRGLAPKAWAQELYQGKHIPPSFQQSLAPLIDHARALISHETSLRTKATAHFLQAFDHAWQEIADERQAIRYSDLTTLLAQTIDSNQADWLDDLYFRLDASVQHLLLDEFQDTSRQQWAVLQPLIDELLAHGHTTHSGRSLFCVGDTKQAIYGWRGGDVRLFDNVADKLQALDINEEVFSTIYRCAQPVLDLVNNVYNNLTLADIFDTTEERAAANHWQDLFPNHQAANPDQPGHALIMRTAPPLAEEPDTPAPPDTEDDDTQTTPAQTAHLRAVAEHTASLHKQLTGRSIAILVARNQIVADLLLELRALGIEASGEGGVPIHGDPAVEAVLAALTLIDHPADEAAHLYVTNSPLGQELRVPSDIDRCPGWAARQRQHLLTRGFGRTVADWTHPLQPHCDPKRWHRLRQLQTLAHQYDLQQHAEPDPPALRPTRFVNYIRTTRIEDPSSAPIRVMTVHAAKGLEFDTVILPDLLQVWKSRSNLIITRDPQTGTPIQIAKQPDARLLDYFPAAAQQARQTQAEDLAERFSSLYVAMTRARHALHILLQPLATTRSGTSSVGSTNKTHAALIRQTLALPLQAREEADLTTLTETGNPNWTSQLSKPDPQPVRPTPSPLTISQTNTPQPKPRPQPTTQTLADCFDTQDQRQAKARGLAVHNLLEHTAFIDEAPPPWLTSDSSARALLIEAGVVTASNNHLSQYLDEARAILQQPEIQEALSRRGAASLHTELPFTQIDEDQTSVTGRIDRLVVWTNNEQPTHAEIIDYKTDRIANTPEDTAATIERHRQQINHYRQAAARMLNLPINKIHGRLVMTHTATIIDLPPEAI